MLIGPDRTSTILLRAGARAIVHDIVLKCKSILYAARERCVFALGDAFRDGISPGAGGAAGAGLQSVASGWWLSRGKEWWGAAGEPKQGQAGIKWLRDGPGNPGCRC